jgi:outer membrane receptor protein involved in Fe transport
MSINRAAHALKFGMQIYRSELNGVQNSHGRGTLEFDGRFTRNPAAPNTTGNEFADYLLGYASRSQRQVGSTRVDMRSTLFAGFLQDDWRVSRKLTVNLGLRYELNTPLADKYGRTAGRPSCCQETQVRSLATNTTTPPTWAITTTGRLASDSLIARS